MLLIPLTAYAADINSDLIEAAKNGDTAQVKALLDKGADVNARDKDGLTALMWAAAGGRTDIVKALLDKGADVNAKTSYGYTALMWAAAGGHTDIVKALLDKGADVNAKDSDGYTALMWAAARGHTDIVKALLDKGADVNAKDEDGTTALMSAARNGHTDTVKALLDKGAYANMKDTLGMTALKYAEANGHAEVVQLLKKAETAMREPKTQAEDVKKAEKLIGEGKIEEATSILNDITPPERYFNVKDMAARILKRSHEVALERYKAKDVSGSAQVLSLAFGLHDQWSGEGSRLEKMARIPISILIQNDYGFFLSEAGEHEAAEEVLRDVVSQSPDRGVARLNLADTLWELGKSEEARNEYEAYAKLIPAGRRPARVAERCPACAK
jgi:thioredoxin-like negative regulator of GroEL